MVDRSYFESISSLSPFEIKDELIKLARTGSERSAKAFLNAGRGNPNWIATRAREAFFLLGQFALTEAKRSYHDPEAGVAGMPPMDGAHLRFSRWVKKQLQMQEDGWIEEDGVLRPIFHGWLARTRVLGRDSPFGSALAPESSATEARSGTCTRGRTRSRSCTNNWPSWSSSSFSSASSPSGCSAPHSRGR